MPAVSWRLSSWKYTFVKGKKKPLFRAKRNCKTLNPKHFISKQSQQCGGLNGLSKDAVGTCRDGPPRLEKKMEKNMENAIKTGVYTRGLPYRSS